jgi:thiol-disulfide isomerase/thioredoxin
MKLKNGFLIFCLFCLFQTAELSAQQIPVLNFEQLEPMLKQKNDTLYVINFWATWCKPCVEELPHFMEINSQYADKKFKMILVSLDFASQLDSKVIPFVKDKKIDSQVVLLSDPDANTWINRVNESWTGSIPATIIYKKDFYFFNENTMSYNELDKIIKQNLN